ncbi:MAG: DUF4157 domain-containing protein [Actinobacteria bacterium]|nr:DUF4157 domain-containing protein [Actinomycetota bacterium]MCI0544919.1 DUF4157 domain-containing protein [Actinomycetota bacterium]MCI0678895.1 DUF4157 domain-containing protein [Actinomycetota bacterium]
MNVGRILADAGYDSEELRAELHPVVIEKVKVMPASRLVRALWGSDISAMTLGRLVLVAPAALSGDRKTLGRLMVHELVHVRQWTDYGVVGFLRRYLGDYLRGRRQGAGHRLAYRAIRLEAEARSVTARFT